MEHICNSTKGKRCYGIERFKIYLIGGMQKFGKDDFEIGNEWRTYFKNKLENLQCDYKIHVINPNDYYSMLDDSTYDSEREIMDFDLNKVKKSDLCIINFNDIYSLGSMAELSIAYDRNIPVIGLCEDYQIELLHPWQKEMTNKIFEDRNSLIDYLKYYYLD